MHDARGARGGILLTCSLGCVRARSAVSYSARYQCPAEQSYVIGSECGMSTTTYRLIRRVCAHGGALGKTRQRAIYEQLQCPPSPPTTRSGGWWTLRRQTTRDRDDLTGTASPFKRPRDEREPPATALTPRP
eukprot:scaffold8780_cov130-Isochrysis_galbana.AAC.3